MKTVKVVVPKDCSRDLLRFLSSTDDIKIIDVHKTPYDIGSFDQGAKIKELSDEFDKVIEHFELEEKTPKGKPIKIDDSELGVILKETERLTKDVIKVLSQIDDRITLAEKELESNKSVIEIAQNLTPFGFSFEDLDDESPYFTIIVGRIEAKRVARFRWNLDAITDSNYVFRDTKSEENYSFIAVGFLERYHDNVNRLLAAYGFEKFAVPERITGNVDKVIQRSTEKIEQLKVKLEEYKEQANVILKTHNFEILAYAEQLHIEQNYMKIFNMMRSTKKNVAFWGWVPQKKIKKVEQAIDDLTVCQAIVEFTTPVFDESEIPTKSSIPKFMRIYNSIVTGYGVPGYNEFNPAILFQIFFPIMFGIMFADVGHGLLFTLLGVYGLTLQKKKLNTDSFMDEIKGYMRSGYMLIIVSGIMAMIFGVLFGSYFGVTSHYALSNIGKTGPDAFIGALTVPDPLWFSPESHELFHGAKPVILMLELSLMLGMLHMTIGYILRFITNIKHKHYKEAFLVTLMWIIFHWALVILVFSVGTNFMQWFDPTTSGDLDLALFWIGGDSGGPITFIRNLPALWFFIGGMGVPLIVMTVYLLTHGLDGVGELLEILLSTLSHTVSYARIFAMNAVHGALSHIFLFTDFTGVPKGYETEALYQAALENAHLEGSLGILNYAGILVGSLVILVLEGLFSFIQSLRLQWVEFFGKVGYQGSGFPFETMAIERQYSSMSRK
jgi:V/A-type H+-transporting ATPase subunit I